ncbi:MAG: biotin--[Clostridia bacterium]|nr:biotin--[acetyl-CoA-carboxylase] ligase [Clostridia bacterium]
MSESIFFEHIPVIDSTNAELSRRIAAGRLMSPICLSSDIQTAGRGRRGRSWLNTDGALMLSLCLEAGEVPTKSLPLISLAAALGVHDAVSRHLPCCAVKWPNDIVCAEGCEIEKLCGILCELVCAPNGQRFAVIGMGLNVNCKEIPDGLRMPASSMHIKLGIDTDIELLKKVIADSVLARYDGLKNDPAHILTEYSKRCITLNRFVEATDLEGTTVAKGFAKRILSDGRLLIEADEGGAAVDAADVSISACLGS